MQIDSCVLDSVFSDLAEPNFKQKLSNILQSMQVSYHFLQLFLSFTNTFTIIWIYYENQALCVLKVVPPKWSDFVLAADIPDGEAYVFVFNSFDIETWNESRLQKIKHVFYGLL